MIREEPLAWSPGPIAVQAFGCLSRTTLGRPAPACTIPAPKPPQTLAAILSPEEGQRLIESPGTRTQRAVLATTYAAGLRGSEVVRRHVRDIDAPRMSLRVEQGKGAKDRDTLLSPRRLQERRASRREYRPALWRFPARGGPRPMDPCTAQKISDAAKRRAGITKPGGLHALRQAFATPSQGWTPPEAPLRVPSRGFVVAS
ncbi:MAG: tyrosine-type recombinase/integrase [Deltaproteobacteria bacterium]|nr:tyrosine-type recombinase/integrase [Deltaproteobacteria bacterium]